MSDESTLPPGAAPAEKEAAGLPAAAERSPGIMARLRAYFFAGILVTAPIGLTLYIIWVIVRFVDNQVTPLIPERYSPTEFLPSNIPGLGLAIMLVVLTLVGWVTSGFIGRLVLRVSEPLLLRTPIVRGVYTAVKQVVHTFVADKSTSFRQVVLVEYPRRGSWALGFVTGKTMGEVQSLTKDEVLNVFIPTTPNPTSGFLLFCPKKEMVFLNMTVDEGIKMVISGGIVTPPDRRPHAGRTTSRSPAPADD